MAAIDSSELKEMCECLDCGETDERNKFYFCNDSEDDNTTLSEGVECPECHGEDIKEFYGATRAQMVSAVVECVDRLLATDDTFRAKVAADGIIGANEMEDDSLEAEYSERFPDDEKVRIIY